MFPASDRGGRECWFGTMEAGDGPCRRRPDSNFERLVSFVVDDSVEVLPPIVPVLHSPGVAVAPQLLEIQVVNNHGLHIGIAFGGNGIAGELGVGRGENPGLGIMDVGVLDKR